MEGGGDVAAERDEYLEALRRVKAEFDNYKKRTDKERVQMIDRANESLVAEICCPCSTRAMPPSPTATRVWPRSARCSSRCSARAASSSMTPEGEPFDPNQHEAVLHEDGDGGPETVAESLRAGYTWRGRVIRPAMVKVRG